ncbi:MAG: hypothetical protein MJA83_05690 [Gammaproteobacteria bacterium]|nr:hypothetical protein [Gammaproteobacteria bacterium]
MKWWTILIAVVVGFGISILWRRSPLQQISRELVAAEQAARVKERVARHGLVLAKAIVEADYAKSIREFDERQKKKAEKLRHDPVAMSRWLARLGKSPGPNKGAVQS